MTYADKETIQGLSGRLLELTAYARQLLEGATLTESEQSEFRSIGFLTVPNVLPAAVWVQLVEYLLPLLCSISIRVGMEHRETSPTTLSVGAMFRRVDPHRIHEPDVRAKVTFVLNELGLTELGSTLGDLLTPLIRRIAGPLSYRHSYFYIYEEGDYVSIHNDHQVGDRVDVQFPVSLNTAGGIRVLSHGYMHMRYDVAGSMNVLGSRVWHEVPPLLRIDANAAPKRLNMGLRFTPDQWPILAQRRAYVSPKRFLSQQENIGGL